MDEERIEDSMLTWFLRTFARIFTLSILSMSIMGLLVSRSRFADIQENLGFGIFDDNITGLPFGSIIQMAGISLILSFACVLLFSEFFFTRMQFIIRIFLLYISVILVCSVFAIIFRWFPAGNFMAWIAFLLASFVFFSLATAFSYLKNWMESKKYERLLANYKARRKHEDAG